MKQSLGMRTGQSLTMTPALQQAIRLLQLSTLDLKQEIQQAIESNLMLELSDDDSPEPDAGAEMAEEAEALNERSSSASDSSDGLAAEVAATEVRGDEPMSDEMPMDADWGDIYDTPSKSDNNSDDDDLAEYRRANQHSGETLLEHLRWQAGLPQWLASCDRRWLAMAVQGLEAAGQPLAPLLGSATPASQASCAASARHQAASAARAAARRRQRPASARPERALSASA